MKDTFALNLPDNLMSNTYDVEVNQYQQNIYQVEK
jgi:hypothetical protein